MKPWIIALILAACCIALLAQSSRPASATRPVGQQGRFQLVMNPAARADTFLLDTATGQIWQRTKYTDLEGQPEVWQYQDRVDSQLELVAWAADHGRKPAPPPVTEAPAEPQTEQPPAPENEVSTPAPPPPQSRPRARRRITDE